MSKKQKTLNLNKMRTDQLKELRRLALATHMTPDETVRIERRRVLLEAIKVILVKRGEGVESE